MIFSQFPFFCLLYRSITRQSIVSSKLQSLAAVDDHDSFSAQYRYRCVSRESRAGISWAKGCRGMCSHREVEGVVQVATISPRCHVTRALTDARRTDADSDAGTLPSAGLGPPSREASGRLCWHCASMREADSIDPRQKALTPPYETSLLQNLKRLLMINRETALVITITKRI